MKKHKEKKLTPEQEIALIEKKLGYSTFERPTTSFDYIDLGDADLNEVLGHRKYGIRVGSMIELFGWESHGKTALATIIGAIAQKVGPKHTYVAKGDLEGSNSNEFNQTMGIDLSKFFLFKPKIAASMKAIKRLQKIDPEKDSEKYKLALAKAEKFQETGQMLCKKIERWIKFKKDLDPKATIILIMDSVTGILVEEEMEADLDNQNMRTNVSLATFMSKLLRRWVSFVNNYNVVPIFINQLRVAPGVMFGSPEYTSGGKALKLYSSIRVKVSRVKGGSIKKHGKVIGINTMITNIKNKVGGAEGHKAGISIYTRKGKWKAMSADQIIKLAKKEKANGN